MTPQGGKRRVLRTPCNKFGLFRQYYAVDYPSHDPDEVAKLSDISNLSVPGFSSATLFQPYPNKNAFLLGEWYWNGGIQNSKETFKQLINIVSDQSFDPADVRNIRWDSFNKELGESSMSDDIWLDEPDAGWIEAKITLSIPFQKNTPNPGPQLYTFPPFHHRNIVSVLKEKMANKQDFIHFHLEPYELQWRRSKEPKIKPIQVYGELYTSPAFLESHEELQASPPEPGCSLPRVIVGLMFGSDSTRLTSFGDASLWPCYMYFGNESKYRRSKPDCNLANHIAYFRKVGLSYRCRPNILMLRAINSCRQNSKTSQRFIQMKKVLVVHS